MANPRLNLKPPAKKKTASPPRKKKKVASKKKQRGGSSLGRFAKRVVTLLIVLLVAAAATYYFGSFEIRNRMERSASQTIQSLRDQAFWPQAGKELLDKAYDSVPNNEGLVVDGGELGHDGEAVLAGVPQHRSSLQILHNKSYINLYDASDRQSRCIALHLNGPAKVGTVAPHDFVVDSRVRPVKASDMQLGKWSPTPIVPAELMGNDPGNKEAGLTSQLVPMTSAFKDGPWAKLTDLLLRQYPKRFGEIWVYAGPVQTQSASKLVSGIPIPDGFYAIAFNLTEDGGLRAISFLLSHDASETDLNHYLSSIEQIEKATGFNFLPALAYDARAPLRQWKSPQLW